MIINEWPRSEMEMLLVNCKKNRRYGSEIFHLGAGGKPHEPQDVARREFSRSSENSEFVIVALKKRKKEKKRKRIKQ